MRPLLAKLFAVSLLATNLFFPSPPARAENIGVTLVGGGSVNWVRGPGVTGSAPSMSGIVEIGVSLKNKAGFAGIYVYPFPTLSGAPLNWGVLLRVFGGIRRVIFIDLRIDLLGFAFGLTNTYTSPRFYDYMNLGMSLGFRIPFGKLISLMPFAAYDAFNYPITYYYTSLQAPFRYYGWSAGAKLALEF